MNVGAVWDLQNTTWLAFAEKKLMLSGTVPKDVPDKTQVVFTAQDEIKGTASRTQMSIDLTRGGGDRNGGEILPTNTVQNSGNKIKLVVGVVFGVAAAAVCGIIKPITTNCKRSDDHLFMLQIPLACFLAICHQCCAAREHVQGVYFINQRRAMVLRTRTVLSKIITRVRK